MSLNCNEINLILQELNLEGAFIQEIIQPGYDTLWFRAVNKGPIENILICTANGATRINRTKAKAPKNEKPLRFNEFLKSRVQGMRINSAKQIGLERIIKMDVSTWKERFYIYIRLWSAAANVIVCDEENNILDCMYRRPKRGEISGGKFIEPSSEISQEKIQEANERFPVRTFDDIDFSRRYKAEEIPGLDFNQKVDFFYSEHSDSLSRESLLAQAEKWFNSKHSKMEHALNNLLAKKESFENADILKISGDLILSNSYLIKNGDTNLDCLDYNTNKEVHIRLNPKLTPAENANEYYAQYKKSISGMDSLIHDIEISKKALKQLEDEYNQILNEKNVIKIEQLLRKETKPKQQEEKTHAGLHFEIDGWTILVGRTAAENDDLLRHTVKGQDMWLHTRDYAGGYVFIKAQKNKTVPLEILLYAGNLAVYHSKARKNAAADLYYTQVKYLRRAKNGPKGLVLPTNEKNLYIKLDEQKLRKLEEQNMM